MGPILWQAFATGRMLIIVVIHYTMNKKKVSRHIGGTFATQCTTNCIWRMDISIRQHQYPCFSVKKAWFESYGVQVLEWPFPRILSRIHWKNFGVF